MLHIYSFGTTATCLDNVLGLCMGMVSVSATCLDNVLGLCMGMVSVEFICVCQYNDRQTPLL